MPRRSRARVEALAKWVQETCCKGRMMKTPAAGGSDYAVEWSEPRCFAGNFFPQMTADGKYSVAPSILVMYAGGDGAGDTSEYLDSRQKINRPDEMGETLQVQLIHTIYNPPTRTGERNGEGKCDPKKALDWNDACDEGSMVLLDWLDDTKAALLGAYSIPGCDLVVKRKTVRWEPLMENGAVADRRPFYLGVVAVTFETVTREDMNETIHDILD